MKKTILTLFVCLACIMLANARWKTPPVIDTLPKRVINGLEVIPIRTTYPEETFWKLRVSDFDKLFQKFESKYPGGLRLESEETAKAMYDWQDHVWSIVPEEIKALEGIKIMLFIDKEGNVFTADFSMTDEVFQKLNTLPRNTLKNLYHNLIKEKCEIIKNMEFHPLRWENEHERACMLTVCGSRGTGKDYVTRILHWSVYSVYGTSNYIFMSTDELKKIDEKMQKRKKSEK